MGSGTKPAEALPGGGGGTETWVLGRELEAPTRRNEGGP